MDSSSFLVILKHCLYGSVLCFWSKALLATQKPVFTERLKIQLLHLQELDLSFHFFQIYFNISDFHAKYSILLHSNRLELIIMNISLQNFNENLCYCQYHNLAKLQTACNSMNLSEILQNLCK